ncbi:MAG: MBL fold metallo-hydrolase [Promethearchaeota archaeon]
MDNEEFSFLDKKIIIVLKERIDSTYKIKSYDQKLKYMEKRKIPQKPISEVLNHFFFYNKYISEKSKKSIKKIIYCLKDKIIIVTTKSGKDIIWNRDRLIQDYGWFFFIAKSDIEERKFKKRKEKEDKKKEITVSEENFQFEDLVFRIKQKENMRPLYHTKEYYQNIKLIKSKSIPQIAINEVLTDFFYKYEDIPTKEKKSIRKIIYYNKEKVIVVKSLVGDKMYENLENLVSKYGWYFYITGVPVGASEISLAIDKIEKRYNLNYFKSLSLSQKEEVKTRVTIYPIVLKPNHNCHVLGLGNLNILLDCGISESSSEESEKEGEEKFDTYKKMDDFKYIEEYLENLPKLILKEGKIESETFNPKIDAIYISHSHFDHISGLKKLIELYPDIPVLCSRITLDLFLLRDSNYLKQETHEEIEEEEYKNIIRNIIYVENGDKIEFKDKNCYISFYHAGHMPGALMLFAKINNFRFLYTGDYTFHDITPFAGTRRFLKQISRPIDYLLIDGTSAEEDFGNISDQFHSLILFLEQKAEYGDNVLIGADPSSLAITFMLIFWRYFRKLQLRRGYKKRPNIYVDMMVRKNIQVINHRYEYIYGPISRLIRDKANPFNSIKFRWFDVNNLEFLREKNNIIISHPPDLSYGVIRNIINAIGRNPHNLVFLAGSIHEQPGMDLISGSEEIEFSETWKVPFRALLINTFAPQLKIKLHADKNQLAEMIKSLEPKNVCFFHQSPKKLEEAVKYVKSLGVEKISIPIKRKLLVLNED